MFLIVSDYATSSNDDTSRAWYSTKRRLPTNADDAVFGRFGHATFISGEELFAVGGSDVKGQFVTSVLVYNFCMLPFL